MANIPTVPGSEVAIQTPRQGAMLNPGAFTLNEGAFLENPSAAGAAARARLGAVSVGYGGDMAVAGGVESAAGVLAGITQDLLKAKRAQIAADADFRMREAQQTFVESLRGNGDESTWGERAKETFERTREDILQAHNVPPGMRRELDTAVRSWGQALGFKAQTMAAVQSVNRAEVAVRSSYDAAGRDGDAIGMANAVNLGRSSKLDPVAMDQLEQGIPRALALTALENGIRVNPQAVYRMLKDGGEIPVPDQNGNNIDPAKAFPPKELEALQHKARVESAAWQRENADNLLQTGADPITGMVPEGVIREKMRTDEITEAFGRSLIASQERKVKAETAQQQREAAKTDRDEFNMTMARIHDATAWGVDPDLYAGSLMDDAARISDGALRQRAINEANHQLAAVKKQGRLDVRPLEQQMVSLMRANRGQDTALVPLSVEDDPGRAGIFGLFARPAQTQYASTTIADLKAMAPAEIEKRYGKGMTVEKVLDATAVHSARLENQMREWLRSPEGLKATFEQANAHRMEIERPYVMDQVKAALSGKAPVRVKTPEEVKLLAPGTPFMTPDGQLRYAR